MLKLALKNLWEHKIRLLASAVAVFLGVAFLSGTFVFTDSLRTVFDDLFSSIYKGTDVLVQSKQEIDTNSPEDTGRTRLTTGQLEAVREVPGVAAVVGDVQGYAQVIDKKNKLVGRSGPPKFGYAWYSDKDLSVYKLFSGTPPQADDQIVVDRGVMKSAKLKLGDRVKVASPKPTKTYTIVGDATYGTSDGALGSTAVFFTEAEAQRLFAAPGRFDAVRARADPGVSDDELVHRVRKALGTDRANADVEVLSGKKATELFRALIGGFFDSFRTVLSVFAFISLFVGTFVIYNSFKIVFTQRTREMAMLRAIGASQRQILTSTVLESFVVGLVASAIGVLGGVGIAIGLKGLLAAVGATLPSGPLILKARTIVLGLAVGLVTTMISSMIPAFKASRVKPLAALRDVAVDRVGATRARKIAAALLYVLAAITLVIGLHGKGTPGAKVVGLSAACALLATIIVGPVISKPLASVFGGRVFGWIVTSFGGLVVAGGVATTVLSIVKSKPPFVINGVVSAAIGVYLVRTGLAAPKTPGRLARENAMRNPSRTSATALALTISTALVSALFVFSASITKTFSGALTTAIKADYLVTSANDIGFSTDVNTKVAALPGVVDTSPVRFAQFRLNFRNRSLGAIDPATIGGVLDLGKVTGSLSALSGHNTIAVADKSMRDNEWKLGDTLPLTFGNAQKATFKIVATYENTEGLSNTYYLTSIASLDPFTNLKLDRLIFVKTDGSNAKAFRAAGEKALFDYPTAKLQTKGEFKKEVVGQLNQILGVILALLGLSMFVAIVGIANTLKLSILERTRELGLLRAVGMGREQTKALVRWEAIVVATIGAIIGLVIGTAYGAALVRVLGKDGTLKVGVPLGTIIGLALGASIIGLYAARRPAKRAAKLNILRAIATE